jgi:polyphosphate kinase 2 (PPK2 family)
MGTIESRIRRVGRLDSLDLSLKLDKDEYEPRLTAAQERLLALRLRCGGLTGDGTLGPPLLVLLEGGDASGKGGALKRLVAELDPRHVSVRAFSAPSEREQRHHYFWRFWPHLPGWGGMCVFDRTWYGRVLVERVEGFASEAEWGRAYGEIAEFERSLTAEGMVIVKLWFEVSPDEQLKRFEKRRDDPLKTWKLTEEDWRNREKRHLYDEAVEEMLGRTDLPEAPWTLIEGDHKKFARVKAIETVCAALERGMERAGLELPEAAVET